MIGSTENLPEKEAYFPSLASMRVAHSELLKHYRQTTLTPEFLSQITDFIRQGQTTGTLLDVEEDRWAAQSLLDYWASLLYRAGQEAPDATLADFDPSLAPELDDRLCPYLGLEAFHEAQHTLFYGRQRLLDKLLHHLQTERFLVVVGSSGSGKSSVVLGGLLPSLKAGKLAESDTWHYYPPMVPGSHPLENLARVLRLETEAGSEWMQQQVAAFKSNPHHLLERMNTHSQPAVLIIDQFEETFTLCREPEIRQALIENLLSVIQSSECRHYLILTMRTDFEDQVAKFPAFQPVFEQAEVRVTALEASELREAIEKPAALVGLKFEAGVVDQLIGDVLGEPAALPLLQFTLLKLWENRERNRVTWERYKHLGGGRLALSRSADAFYGGLIPEEQVTAKRILLKMVRPSEGLEVTSNRIPRQSVYQMGEAKDRVERVLDKLIQSRLVRLSAGEQSEDDQVEVAHEALIRNWPLLVEWLEDERVNLRQRLRLTAAAQQWQERGRDPSVLWRGGLLEDAGRYEDLSQLEAEFVQGSEQAEALQRRQELEAMQKLYAAKLMLGSALGIGAVVLVATIATLIAWRSVIVGRVENFRQKAEISWLSDQQLDALVAAIQAQKSIQQNLLLQIWPPAEDLKSKVTATLSHTFYNGQERQRFWHSGLVISAEFSPDGQSILTASADNTARLWNRNGQLLAELKGHTDSVYSASFSPDGQSILTASADNTARLWNLKGQMLAEFKGHTSGVNSASFSPDGQSILTASVDNTARLWNLKGQMLAEFKGHTSGVNSASFSPDGQSILTASADNTARLWNLKGQMLAEFKGHFGSVNSASFSPDGQSILTASYDNTARLWNLKGQMLAEFKGHTDSVISANFSPDGQSILTASWDKTARLWNRKGELLTELKGHTDLVNSANFSPDGQSILTTSFDNTARLWNRNGQILAEFKGHTDLVYSASFSPDGQSILTTSFDNTARLWNRNGEMLAEFKGHTDSVYSASFSPDGQSILTASWDKTARLWNRNGELLAELKGHTDSINSANFSPDGQSILTTSFDNTARLWNRNGEMLAEFKGHTDSVYSASFSPDGQSILTASFDNTARLWNRNGELLAEFKGHTAPVISANFSPDGQSILTASADTARLWNLKGQILAEFKGHTDSINSANFSPDGQSILTASQDKAARLWNRNGEMLAEFKGHTSGVNSASFSPDGQSILTASFDNTARLWNLKGQILAEFKGHTSGVNSASFSPDGQSILTASFDNTARLWNRKGELLAEFKGHTAPVISASFSPDGQSILTASYDKTARLWKSINFNTLLSDACHQVGDYLKYSQDVEEADRHLCEDVPPISSP
jgi:WD40 repeat protein/energy-coupling factor transporter ATP-binding protein EcfA2